MTATIIDDEKLIAKLIANLLQTHFPAIEIIDILHDLPSAYESLVRSNPDILFLDMQLHDDISVELVKNLNLGKTKIIVISGHSEYAVSMIEHDVFAYLLKPIDIAKFKNAVQKAMNNTNELKSSPQITTQQFITINTAKEKRIIPFADIIRLEASGNYCSIILKDNSVHLLSKGLGEIEKNLPCSIFLRVHSSHIVNLNFVTSISKDKPPVINLSNASCVPIAARRYAEVSKQLNTI